MKLKPIKKPIEILLQYTINKSGNVNAFDYLVDSAACGAFEIMADTISNILTKPVVYESYNIWSST